MCGGRVGLSLGSLVDVSPDCGPDEPLWPVKRRFFPRAAVGQHCKDKVADSFGGIRLKIGFIAQPELYVLFRFRHPTTALEGEDFVLFVDLGEVGEVGGGDVHTGLHCRCRRRV